MAGIGHVAVGVVVGRMFVNFRSKHSRLSDTNESQHSAEVLRSSTSSLALFMVMGVAFSMLPDADILAFSFGIPYHAPWGHRGASHSLVFACGIGLFIGMLLKVVNIRSISAVSVGLFVGLTVASHGLLDTLTNGGLGVALLWPFSNVRFFAPWRPLPVSPIGFSILSPYGLSVIKTEFLSFFPLFLYAFWFRDGSLKKLFPLR